MTVGRKPVFLKQNKRNTENKMDLITPDFGLLFWTGLVFVLLLFLLTKFAWKPILGAVNEREKKISEALDLAERTKAEMKQLAAQNQQLLAEAAKEREGILKAAREASDKMVSEAREKASAESAKLLEQARETIHNEKMRAVTEIKNEVGKLSIEIAEKLLRENLRDESKQNESIARLLNDVNLN